jgi:hypothetical protein
MKVLAFAVLLTVMQAARPVPQQAADSAAGASNPLQKDASDKKAQSGTPVITAKPRPAESDQSDSSNNSDDGKQDTQHSIRINKLLPATIPSPKRDWADWGTWGFTFLLAITSGFQVWLLCRTLTFVRRQTHEMKRQRVTMGGQLKVMQGQLAAMERQTGHLEASVWAAQASANAADKSIELVINKERARLRVEPLELDLAEAPTYFARYLVEFNGTTPAFISSSGALGIITASIEQTENPFIPDLFIPPVISASTESEVRSAPLWGLRLVSRRDLVTNTLFIHFFGYIKYLDVFDKERETVFGFIWEESKIPGISGEWKQNGKNYAT